MTAFTVRFVLSTNRFDPDGFLYCKDVQRLMERNEIAELMRGRIVAQLVGGYAFVVNDRVWNSHDRVPFDPDHLRIGMDTIVFAELMLEQLAAQIDDRPIISCNLTEMSTLSIEFVSSTDVMITGVDLEGRVAYPPEMVSFSALLKHLLSATDDFLRSAEDYIEREAGDDPPTVRESNREFIDRWRDIAERLTQCR